MLGITYKSAWFMAHRIRYTMTQEPLSSKLDGVVEIDEAYIGGKRRQRNNPTNGPDQVKIGKRVFSKRVRNTKGLDRFQDKEPVLSLVQRGGKVRSFHMPRVTHENLRPVLSEYLAEGVHIMTDSSSVLMNIDMGAKHDTVNHSAKEYVRHENGVCISTNTVEGYFATLKRGINGVYHHVSRQHLNRYLTEFDFRYNARGTSDVDRAKAALKGAEGKRLTYRDSCGKAS